MIGHEPPAGAVAPLPILPTAAEAWRTVIGNFGALTRASALPFILLLCINITAHFFDLVTYRLIWTFGAEVPWTLMGVAWLHRLLLAPAGAKIPFFTRPGRRHLWFLGYSLLLSIIWLPLIFYDLLADALVLEGPPRIAVYYGLYATFLFFSLRFAFVYAATAVGEDYSLALAWRHSRDIAFNLFIVVGAFAMLPWEIFDYLLGIALPLEGAAAHLLSLANYFAWHAGFWILNGIYLAIIAIAFRTCTGWVPPPDRRIVERFD